MDLTYPATLSNLENGDIMVRFQDVPEAITCGKSREEALEMAQDALTVALSSYIDDHRDIPKPSKPKRGQPLLEPSPMVTLKLEIYQTMRDQGITAAELARRMGKDRSHIRRLLNLDHHSRMDQIEAALLAVGKRLVVETTDVA